MTGKIIDDKSATAKGIALPDMTNYASDHTMATIEDIPTQYLASASVASDTLTIVDSAGSSITFQGGGGSSPQTWREIEVDGVELIAATASSPLNLVAGSYVTLTPFGSQVSISMSASSET